MKNLALILFLPIQTFASFNGAYSGPGQSIKHPQEKVRKCSEVFLRIKQDAQSFRVIEGGYKCEDLQAAYPDFTLEIKNGKLISDHIEVGNISENEMNLYKSDKQEGYSFHLRLQKKSQQLIYQEDWTDNTHPALTIKGILLPAIR